MIIFELIETWFKTRPYRLMWLSIPAILLGIAWVSFGIVLEFNNPAKTRVFYSSAADRALATRDFQTARVAANWLLLSGPESREENLFRLALAELGLGQVREGSALLNLAAPLEKPGYAPAHLFAARQLLTRTNVTAQMLQQAEIHLNHVLKLEPNSIEAHQMLGRLYFQMRNWDMAKPHLLAVASAKPDTALLLAMLARAQNDDIGMRQWAGTAAGYFQGKVKKAAEENPPDRLAWVTALAIQERYAEAAEILKTGMKNSGNKIYASGLANIYADWAAYVAKTDPHNVVSRLKLIQQGLEFDPQNLGLLEQLLLLTHLPEAETSSARAVLTQMLAQGGSSAMLHFVVGNDAFQHGDMEQAGEHFKLAFDLAPNLPVVANRMALLLAIGKQPDLPRALAISQTLVEKYPNEPDVRNTHGIILAHLGRWEEAVKDLEFALPNVHDKNATHTALAQAYRKLGMSELADEHERLAREPSEPSAPAASKP